MKAVRKLMAATAVVGLLGASAPASAFITLQFFDDSNAFLGSIAETSVTPVPITNPLYNVSFTGTVNGWNLNAVAGYSQYNPLKLNLTGFVDRITNYDGNVTLPGGSVINVNTGGFSTSANNALAQTMKIRLVETNFPGIPAGSPKGPPISLNDNFAITNDPAFGLQSVAVQIQGGGTDLALAQANSGFAANPAFLTFNPGLLCGTANNANNATGCNPGPTNVPTQLSQTFAFSLDQPANYAPFTTNATLAGKTGSNNVWGPVGTQNSGFVLIAGFDVTMPSVDTQGVGGYSFTNTITLNAVPEPGTLALLGASLIGLAGVGRKRKVKA